MTDILAAILLVAFFGTIVTLRMQWALGLFAFLLPIYQVRFRFGQFPTTALEIIVAILVVIWLIRILSDGTWRAVRFPYGKYVSSVTIAGLVSVAASPDSWAGLGLFRAYILEPVLVYFVTVNTCRTLKDIRFILFGLGTSVLVIGLVSILQWLGLVPGVLPYITEAPRRATGVFGFPTAVGKLFAPTLSFFGAWLLADAREKRAQFWLVGVVVFGLLGVLTSVSRGALMAAVVSLFCVALLTRWRRTALMVGIVWLCILVLLPTFRDSVMSVVRGSDVSSDVHLVLWKGTVRLLADRPVFGTGLAGFPLLYGEYKEAAHTEFFPNPDNLFLTLWAELGLLGLVAFFWLCVRLMRDGIHVFRESDATRRFLGLGVFAVLVSILAHGIVDTPYFKNDLAMQFWLFVALLAAQKQIPSD